MKILMALLWILITPPVVTPAPPTSPLNLNWTKEYKIFEPPTGFRYYMGDIEWNQLVYSGTEDILGAETELQLYFVKGRIAKAILILGTEGIDTHNCVSKYKTVVKWLNKKYGHFQHELLEKDPLIDELIYVSVCEPVQEGLLHIKNTWRVKGFVIYSALVGDETGFYVEIEYISRKLRKSLRKVRKNKILKQL